MICPLLAAKGRRSEQKTNCNEILHGAAIERATKRNQIILRAYAKTISWIEAAEVLGMSCRHLRRIKEAYEKHGSREFRRLRWRVMSIPEIFFYGNFHGQNYSRPGFVVRLK
ncbi:MAG: hypothetical protein H0V90_10545 [Blastocatellia bacterium]|nr:hypothetical protein [Blastocatellia bacterium]